MFAATLEYIVVAQIHQATSSLISTKSNVMYGPSQWRNQNVFIGGSKYISKKNLFIDAGSASELGN